MAVKQKKLRSLHYSKALVICHGLSELQITKYIYTNLHLPVRTYAKDNGKHSIQITSLLNLLSSAPFGSLSQFCDEYTVQAEGSGNKQRLVNFKVFIIMDTDDCTDQQKADFMNGRMFSDHWLSPYIVPIANIPNLEKVFEKAKLIRKIKSSEKGTYYSETFPINKGQLTPGTVAEIEAFCDKLEKRKDTNFPDMIHYFLSLLQKV